ncbi:DUF4125 family protein [Peptococcus simiae]|uniref:DUF4125 family protein n=1 Tax=Peptococcus simiae TaxID=1643805 RepID=A0ABW9H214_9FIRM
MPTKDALIQALIDLEWSFFTQVQGLNGRALCQENPQTFAIMRRAQHQIFSEKTLDALMNDLLDAAEAGRNPMTEKYARMMEQSDPDYFARELALECPTLSAEKATTLQALRQLFADAQSAFSENAMAQQVRGRVAVSGAGEVSGLDYLMGELATWSMVTLSLALADIKAWQAAGRNPVEAIVAYTVDAYRGKDTGEV